MNFLFVFLVALQAPAQTTSTPPDSVVAILDGKKMTAAEIKALLAILPPQSQQNFKRDPRGFLNQLGMMRKMSEMAVQSKLDQQSPYKEQLEFNRHVLLFNAQSNETLNHTLVTAEDQKKYYAANPDQYAQVKVKVIYISFGASGSAADAQGRKVLTEAEAKTKIEKILSSLRAGADFVKLAKQHSEDADSVAKDADFGTIRRSDKLPDEIKTAVFATKPGQVSEPVRQPNGFYLFRVEESGMRPYDEVKDEIFTQIQQARFAEWMDKMRKSVDVKIENEAFFAAP